MTSVTAVVEPLDDTMLPALIALADAEPLTNAILATRLAEIGTLDPARLGALVFGVRDGDRLRAAAFNGGNLLPVGGDPESWRALGRFCGDRRRICTSIVGPAPAVMTMWDELRPAWGPPRELRCDQPLLVVDEPPPASVPRHPHLRPARPDELDAYLPAAASMFCEELGVSPLTGQTAAAYQRRVEGLLRDGRAFAVMSAQGEVLFKADIGALTRHTCQLQGVWVRPDLRGQGLGTSALAAVVDRALTLAPTVSLYVNAFNTPARRTYDALGMRHAATLATVLF